MHLLSHYFSSTHIQYMCVCVYTHTFTDKTITNCEITYEQDPLRFHLVVGFQDFSQTAGVLVFSKTQTVGVLGFSKTQTAGVLGFSKTQTAGVLGFSKSQTVGVLGFSQTVGGLSSACEVLCS